MDNNYTDGFLTGAIVARRQNAATKAHNQKVFDQLVDERDQYYREAQALKKANDGLNAQIIELKQSSVASDRIWADRIIKDAMFFGYRRALQDVASKIEVGDNVSFFGLMSGIAKSTIPEIELSNFEAMASQNAIKDLSWALQELAEDQQRLFWEHAHRTFKFTFIKCKASDAAPVADQFKGLLEWTRPDMSLIEQYQPK